MDDDTPQPDDARERNGRFRKGISGNPAGRPPGILNEATRTAALLLGGEAGALTRRAIELALSGNLAALRLCLDRIIAPQREQPASFTFPENNGTGDIDAAIASLTRAAASGEVTPHATALLRLGEDAGQWLALIPDTPELIEADLAFIAAHPLPLERESAHPLVTEIQEAASSLSRWLDWLGRIDTIDQRPAAFAAEHLNIHDPTDPEAEEVRIQLLRERRLILA